MRLSEAIELGSTLIGETREVFYRRIPCEGCALGAAWVAIGKLERSYDDEALASAFPIYNHKLSAHEAEIMGWNEAAAGINNLAFVISALHSSYEIPRLELARRVRLIENLHPEIPGYEPQREYPDARDFCRFEEGGKIATHLGA